MKNLLTNHQLGKALHDQRKTKGIKQSTIARNLKVSLSYISKVENGKIPIYAFLLFQYCKAIDLPVQDIFNAIADAL